MALLSFPASPVNNQLYPVTPVVGQNQYRWDSTNSTWVLLGAATAVTPGCYGDATNVASFCVDAQGRLTSAVNVPLSSVSPDLQIVTDQGAVTTNTVTVAGLVAAGLTYPLADGTLGDVLVTDGAGLLSFVTPSIETLQTITDNGAVSTNTVTVAGLVAAGLTYPLADGTTGQVLDTDGGGNLGWATVPTVVAVPTSSMDPGNDNEVAFDTSGNFYFYKGLTWWKVAGVTF